MGRIYFAIAFLLVACTSAIPPPRQPLPVLPPPTPVEKQYVAEEPSQPPPQTRPTTTDYSTPRVVEPPFGYVEYCNKYPSRPECWFK